MARSLQKIYFIPLPVKLGRLNVILGGTPVLKDNHVYKIAASIPSVLLVSSS